LFIPSVSKMTILLFAWLFFNRETEETLFGAPEVTTEVKKVFQTK